MEMANLDISILQKQPQLDCSIILEIQPLSPLSMVSELPGSYYKTLKIPDKKMLCGLLENLLGWHVDLADRKTISKEIKQLREKWANRQNKTLSDKAVIPYTDYTKGSTYVPLLMDYFEIQNIQPVISKVIFYNDLWNKAFRRSDSTGKQPTHAKGTFNIDYSLIPIKRELPRDAKKQQNVDNEALGKLFGDNIGKFPFYFSTPTNREYIAMEGKYEVSLNIDAELYTMLQEKILTDNLCYLGNSEGWVDLKFKEL